MAEPTWLKVWFEAPPMAVMVWKYVVPVVAAGNGQEVVIPSAGRTRMRSAPGRDHPEAGEGIAAIGGVEVAKGGAA